MSKQSIDDQLVTRKILRQELESYVTKKFLKEEFFKQNTLIAQTLLDFRKEMRANFKQIDKRFGQIDKRFGQIDKRFGQMDERFKQMDERFDDLSENSVKTINRHSDRLGTIEAHLNLVAT